LRGKTPRLTGLAAAFVLTLGMAMPSVANDVSQVAPIHQQPVAADQAVNELSNTWFVELASPPGIDGTAPGQLKRERDAFRANARGQGLQFTQRFEYETLFNGLSITLERGSVATLQRVSGVKAIWPVATFELDPVEQISPELATALAMTGADVAQSELGLTGAGVRVAVMDTGIDYHHPDLGGCFGPGCRVAAGWDFVGDAFNADPSSPAYNPVPAPDPDPDDCNGHGTHVAGIVGASGEVTGVAPGVTFGAYRVFGCEGSTTADIMTAAMERAHKDRMQVLNMSIGSAFQWPQYPTARAADKLVQRGMVVVASIGNSGANGVYATGAPGNGKDVIGVASFDNSHVSALTFTVNPGGHQVAYLPLATTPDPPTSGTSDEVVYIGRGCVDTMGDTHLEDPDGKVALLVRGDCTFQEKYQGAADAGATGVVIHNNVTGLFAGGGVTPRDIFGIGISLVDGQAIRALLDADETVTLTWTDERVNAVNPTGGLISSFSSYGLAPDLSFKPNIGAPGGLIRSTYPLELGGYAIVSGTSMAAPHVAGAVALYLEANPKAKPVEVKVALQNSAVPKNWWGDPGLGFLDNAHRQGAGMLAIDRALLASTSVTPSEIAMGESEAGAQTRTLTVRNSGSAAVTYQLGHVATLSTGGSTFAPGFFLGNSVATFAVSEVTVPAGGSASVDVTITPATGPNLGQYGGYLVLQGDDGSTLRVPYGGFVGDYQSIIAIPAGFQPVVAELTACTILVGIDCTAGGSWLPLAGGGTFTLDTSGPLPDVPYLIVHLDHQVQKLEMVVTHAASGKPIHPVFNKMVDISYMGRNSTPSSFFAFSWDGTRIHGNGNNAKTVAVPDGDYVIELRALKALGDPGNPAHWETWSSPVITIDRP
jgi:minor extracellular serine protease Vpr